MSNCESENQALAGRASSTKIKIYKTVLCYAFNKKTADTYFFICEHTAVVLILHRVLCVWPREFSTGSKSAVMNRLQVEPLNIKVPVAEPFFCKASLCSLLADNNNMNTNDFMLSCLISKYSQSYHTGLQLTIIFIIH